MSQVSASRLGKDNTHTDSTVSIDTVSQTDTTKGNTVNPIKNDTHKRIDAAIVKFAANVVVKRLELGRLANRIEDAFKADSVTQAERSALLAKLVDLADIKSNQIRLARTFVMGDLDVPMARTFGELGLGLLQTLTVNGSLKDGDTRRYKSPAFVSAILTAIKGFDGSITANDYETLLDACNTVYSAKVDVASEGSEVAIRATLWEAVVNGRHERALLAATERAVEESEETTEETVEETVEETTEETPADDSHSVEALDALVAFVNEHTAYDVPTSCPQDVVQWVVNQSIVMNQKTGTDA